MAETIWGYKAVKPIRAEHPIGSGNIVEYKPGDEVPAGDWGASANWLIERDKIMRYGLNLYEDGTSDYNAVQPDEGEVEGAEFPRHDGGPWYTISDGTQIKGKQNAIDAEAALGGSNE